MNLSIGFNRVNKLIRIHKLERICVKFIIIIELSKIIRRANFFEIIHISTTTKQEF